MLEVHPALEEDVNAGKYVEEFTHVMALIVPYAVKNDISLDWHSLRTALFRKDGVPVAVGRVASRMATTPRNEVAAITP
jgi:hypothetical protein